VPRPAPARALVRPCADGGDSGGGRLRLPSAADAGRHLHHPALRLDRGALLCLGRGLLPARAWSTARRVQGKRHAILGGDRGVRRVRRVVEGERGEPARCISARGVDGFPTAAPLAHDRGRGGSARRAAS
jgi:hypothetical protein